MLIQNIQNYEGVFLKETFSIIFQQFRKCVASLPPPAVGEGTSHRTKIGEPDFLIISGPTSSIDL